MPVTLTGVLLVVASSVCAGFMVVALDYGAASDPVWAAAGYVGRRRCRAGSARRPTPQDSACSAGWPR